MALSGSLPSPAEAPGEDSHKGLYGTVLVVAGGRGMAGAAALCGASALRSGPGWSGSPARPRSSRPSPASSRAT